MGEKKKEKKMEEGEDKYAGNVKFNAGFFQIQRIHEVQRMVNIAKINPKSFNLDYNIWNYELWFNNLNTLIDEIWPKLSDSKENDEGEKASVEKTRKRMIDIIYNVKVLSTKVGVNGEKNATGIDDTKFKPIYMSLIAYDNYVKELMNSHGWNNPDFDDDDDPY